MQDSFGLIGAKNTSKGPKTHFSNLEIDNLFNSQS